MTAATRIGNRYEVGRDDGGLIAAFQTKAEAMAFAHSWARKSGLDCDVTDVMAHHRCDRAVARIIPPEFCVIPQSHPAFQIIYAYSPRIPE